MYLAFVMQCMLFEQKRSWSWTQTVLYMQSLHLYILNFICALAHVLCILSPRPEVIAMDVKLRERKSREAENHIHGGNRTKAQSDAALWGRTTIRGPFSSRDQDERPSVFTGRVSWALWVSSKYVYMKQKLAENPCISNKGC